MFNKYRIGYNDARIAKAIFAIAVFPSLFGVVFSFIGVRSYITLIAYLFVLIYIIKLGRIGLNIGAGFLVLYIAYFLFTISYSISSTISVEKFISILYNILLPVTLISFLMYRGDDKKVISQIFQNYLQKYSSQILLFLLILLIFGFTEKSDVDEGRLTIIGMRNPIWCSRFVGFLMLSIIIHIFERKKCNLLHFLGICSAWVILVNSGSRGPILSIVLVIILLLFPKLKITTKLLIVIGIFVGYEMFITFSNRLTYGTTEYSNLARIELFNIVFKENTHIITGYGIGSFGLLYKGYEYYYYPHNIFLETLIETGIIGIIFLLILLFKVYKERKLNIIYYIYTFYFFINSLFSGDICGNNNFFIFASLLLISSERMSNKHPCSLANIYRKY